MRRDALKRRHSVLTAEKRALIKFIAVAEARGKKLRRKGRKKAETLFLKRIVEIADLYVAFIAARLAVVTGVKFKLLPGNDARRLSAVVEESFSRNSRPASHPSPP